MEPLPDNALHEVVSSRHARRRIKALRNRKLSEPEISTKLDPLLSSNDALSHLGGISQMTLWRWRRDRGFPPPDYTIAGRSFWRFSTLEGWLATQKAALAATRESAS